MSHGAVNNAYEVALGPPAIRVILGLRDPGDRNALGHALRTELINGPNAHIEYMFDSDLLACSDPDAGQDGSVYTATPLSFAGYTAVHRPLTREELTRLEQEQGSSAAPVGFYVIDVLPAESVFT